MKIKRKTVIIIAVAVAILLICAAAMIMLVKGRKILLNKIFISAGDTVGVDVSKYQMDIDMDELVRQDISFIYIKKEEIML